MSSPAPSPGPQPYDPRPPPMPRPISPEGDYLGDSLTCSPAQAQYDLPRKRMCEMDVQLMCLGFTMMTAVIMQTLA